jgi:hypothetical protein
MNNSGLRWIIHGQPAPPQLSGGGEVVAHEDVVNYLEWATTKALW